MESTPISTKKSILALSLLILFTALTLAVPAKYVGIKRVREPSLVLLNQDDLAELNNDLDKNGTPDWKDMLTKETLNSSSTQQVGVALNDAAKKRLDDPNNITSSFSKNVYMASVYAKQNGNLTEEEKQTLASNLIAEESAKLTSKIYEVTDLHLTKEETESSRKEYVNTLGIIYKKTGGVKLTTDDLTTMRAYLTNKDASVLDAFVVKKNILDRAISQLLLMSVPYSAAPYHLLLINSLSRYVAMLDNFSKASSDPLRSTLAYNDYVPTVKSLSSALNSIQSYITIENITFTKEDAGKILITP